MIDWLAKSGASKLLIKSIAVQSFLIYILHMYILYI